MKPLLEKFLSCGEVEVLRLDGIDFALKKITTHQAEYLNAFYEYFRDNPLEFVPFAIAIVVDSDKERLKKFLTKENYENPVYDEYKLRMLIHAICIQSLNLRPISLDYALSFSIKDVITFPSIMNRFIAQLIYYGYKKSEIDEFSNNKIIRLALEEMYLRDKTECFIFLADFISSMDKRVFPLSYDTLNLIQQKAEALKFDKPDERAKFLKVFYEVLRIKPDVKKQDLKTKSIEDIKQEIKRKQSRVSDLPR